MGRSGRERAAVPGVPEGRIVSDHDHQASDAVSSKARRKCIDCRRRPARTRSRCPACYERFRTRQMAYGRWESSYVDAALVRAHVLELREAGLSNSQLGELTGVTHTTIGVLITGRPGRGTGPSKKVLRSTADRLLAVPVPTASMVADRAAKFEPRHPAAADRVERIRRGEAA